MAVRKPLVIVSGQIEQLQSADSIATTAAVQLTNDESGSIVIGTPVYMDAADGVKKANASASGTKDVIGLVADSPSIGAGSPGGVLTGGVLTATTTQWDAVAGTTGGLAFGVTYYLSETAGLLTSTPPSTSAHYICPLGIALSTTDLNVAPLVTVKL